MKYRILQPTPSFRVVVQKDRAHTAWTQTILCCLRAFNILSYSNTCKEECPHVHIKPVWYSYGKMFQVPDMLTFMCLISPCSIHPDTDDTMCRWIMIPSFLQTVYAFSTASCYGDSHLLCESLCSIFPQGSIKYSHSDSK